MTNNYPVRIVTTDYRVKYTELARLYEIQREVVLEMRAALKELMGESERMRPFHKLPDGMRTAMVRAHRALDGKKNNGQ